MTGLFDTSVLVGLEQQRVGPQRLPAQAAVCVITLEELWLGFLSAGTAAAAERLATYRLAEGSFETLPVDGAVARASAEIRAEGRRRQRRYEIADAIIGATARVHALPLYTQDAGMLGMAGVDVRVL